MSLLANHITFGVEIECYVGYLLRNKTDHGGAALIDILRKALQDIGIPITIKRRTSREDSPNPTEGVSPYAEWAIDCDASLDDWPSAHAYRLLKQTPQPSKSGRATRARAQRVERTAAGDSGWNVYTASTWLGLTSPREFISKIYHISDLHGGGFGNGLGKLLGFLHRKPWYVGHNELCGLHVHVGLPVQQPVLALGCLGPLRRLAALGIVCEIAMENMAPRDARTRYARAVGQLWFHGGFSDVELLNYVLRCRTVWDLQQQMLVWPQDWVRWGRQRVVGPEVKGPQFGDDTFDWDEQESRYWRMAFSSLEHQFRMPRGDDAADTMEHLENNRQLGKRITHGTVEFRVHPGTVERVRIEMWTRVCVGMVRTCVAMGDTEFRVCLMREGGRWIKLRRFLECFVRDPGVTRYYLQREGIVEGPAPRETGDRDLGDVNCNQGCNVDP